MYDDCMIISLRFPQKLWRIVNECQSGAIRWNTSGRAILLDYKKFQEQYLDSSKSIFKTKNITSFIRQLNLYGFRKVTSHNRDPICNSQNPDVHEFLHENFRTGRPDLLSSVCRKTTGKMKFCQRRSTSNNVESDFLEKDSNRMSRLRMCRLALTEALEQITQEYQRSNCIAKSNECFASAINSEETVTELIEVDLFTAPNHESDMEWITKDAVSLSSEKDNTSKEVTYSWCVHPMDKHHVYLRIEKTD